MKGFGKGSITQLASTGSTGRSPPAAKKNPPAGGFFRNSQANGAYFFLVDFLDEAGSTAIASSST